jgi:hypothetical protein
MSRLITSNQSQLTLITNSFAALLPPDHPVFFFDKILEELDLKAITSVLDLEQKRGRPSVRACHDDKAHCLRLFRRHCLKQKAGESLPRED